MRRDKINYYLDIAETVLERGTCLRRNYGAVIVNNDRIISTGYTGNPKGEANCCDTGVCLREELKIPSGERYELCKSVHAEQNAIIQADSAKMVGATLYLVGINADGSYVNNAQPCDLCKRFIKNAEIERVISRVDKDNFEFKLIHDL